MTNKNQITIEITLEQILNAETEDFGITHELFIFENYETVDEIMDYLNNTLAEIKDELTETLSVTLGFNINDINIILPSHEELLNYATEHQYQLED